MPWFIAKTNARLSNLDEEADQVWKLVRSFAHRVSNTTFCMTGRYGINYIIGWPIMHAYGCVFNLFLGFFVVLMRLNADFWILAVTG